MVAATGNFGRDAVQRIARRLGIWCTASVLLQLLSYAQAQPADEGIFITVPKPVTSPVNEHIKAKTARALERGIRTIVYDFSPPRPGGADHYGSCRDLADYLTKVQANTVAFVHGDVTGHRVLTVLACKEIVMSRKATLGNALQKWVNRRNERDRTRF